MSHVLRRETRGAAQIWTVARPEARNAIDERVVSALEAALSDAEQDAALRSVVLTGEGELAFISGADLKSLRAMPQEQRMAVDERMTAVLTRLRQLPVPVFAALNGVVVGGGAEVALSCDLRIAEPHTTLTFKHAAMGVSPGWGGLAPLLRVVTYPTAARLLFTALPMPAPELLRLGLVDEISAPGQSLARTLALADAVAEVSPTAVAAIKDLLRSSLAIDVTAAPSAERQTFQQLCVGADHQEALRAFAEKRPPRFGPCVR